MPVFGDIKASFRPRMTAPARGAPGRAAPVFGGADNLEVGWSVAVLPAAHVVEIHAFGYRTVEHFISNAVRHGSAATLCAVSGPHIRLFHRRAKPAPARCVVRFVFSGAADVFRMAHQSQVHRIEAALDATQV